uniref:Uncharacterized protein n=1 Tax=Meloidogyne incognita TaxID=6306 RepID=A0A914LGP7_MELIC
MWLARVDLPVSSFIRRPPIREFAKSWKAPEFMIFRILLLASSTSNPCGDSAARDSRALRHDELNGELEASKVRNNSLRFYSNLFT